MTYYCQHLSAVPSEVEFKQPYCHSCGARLDWESVIVREKSLVSYSDSRFNNTRAVFPDKNWLRKM